jgi:hypothetical protein
MTCLFITSLTLQNSKMPSNGPDLDILSLARQVLEQRAILPMDRVVQVILPCLQNMDRDRRL